MNVSKMEVTKQVKECSGISGGISLDLGRVDFVDTIKSSCKVYTFKQSALLNDVKVAFAYANANNGFIKFPEIGSLCLVLTDTKQQSFIINYLPSKEFTETNSISELLEFSYILKGDNGSLIELSRFGDISLSSNLLDTLILEHGANTISSKNNIYTQNYTKVEQYTENPNITEQYYDEKINSLLSSEQIADKILLGEDIELEDRTPLIKVQKIHVLDENGDLVKLNININQELNKEACYEININDVFTVMIDKDGSMKIVGNKLVLDFDTVDFTACNNIVGLVR